jgi:hypothetical protein
MLANAAATRSMFGAMTLSRSNQYGFLKRGMKNLSFDFCNFAIRDSLYLLDRQQPRLGYK